METGRLKPSSLGRMSLHKVKHRLPSVIKCVLCNNTVNEARKLTCSHVFCTSCLTEYIRTRQSTILGYFTCPCCPEKHSVSTSTVIDQEYIRELFPEVESSDIQQSETSRELVIEPSKCLRVGAAFASLYTEVKYKDKKEDSLSKDEDNIYDDVASICAGPTKVGDSEYDDVTSIQPKKSYGVYENLRDLDIHPTRPGPRGGEDDDYMVPAQSSEPVKEISRRCFDIALETSGFIGGITSITFHNDEGLLFVVFQRKQFIWIYSLQGKLCWVVAVQSLKDARPGILCTGGNRGLVELVVGDGEGQAFHFITLPIDQLWKLEGHHRKRVSYTPSRLTYNEHNEVIVTCDEKHKKIYTYSKNGQNLKVISLDPIKLSQPVCAVKVANGFIVADWETSHVMWVSDVGKPTMVYKGPVHRPLQCPYSITVHSGPSMKDHILIVDETGNFIQEVDARGNFIRTVVSEDDGIFTPHCTHLTNTGKLFTAHGDHRVKISSSQIY